MVVKEEQKDFLMSFELDGIKILPLHIIRMSTRILLTYKLFNSTTESKRENFLSRSRHFILTQIITDTATIKTRNESNTE